MFNISQKLALLCLLMVLFGSLPVFYLVYADSRAYLEAETKAKMAQRSRAAMRNIDYFIYERIQDVRANAQDPYLNGSFADEQAVQERLAIFKQKNPLYASVSTYSLARVRLVDTEGHGVGKLHRRSPYWLGLDSADWAMDVAMSESLGKPVLHFAAKVADYDTAQPRGVVVSRVLIDRLYDIFRAEAEDPTLSQELAGAASVALVDREGLILYANRQPADVLQTRHRAFTAFQWQTDRNGLGNRAQGDFELDGQFYFFARQEGYLNYRGNGWVLLIQLPRESVLAPANALRDRVRLAVLGMGVLGIVVSLGVGLYFTRPIVRLTEVAKKLAGGTLDPEKDTQGSTFRRGDELGVLARDFRQMAQELDQRMQEQLRLNTHIAAQKDELHHALQDLSKKNKNITSSINYALKIQTAFLPEREGLAQLFPESFLMFRPKDIVSGDFYWFRQVADPTTGQPLLVVATVDCTGHGVPGALMTMVGENLLYQALVHDRLLDPAEAIHRMDDTLGKMLRRGQGQGTPDGMDLALCVIDPADKTLRFAGAHQSAYLVRAGEVHELRGDRYAIGGNAKVGLGRRVATQNWHLEPGDLLYLFTDGFSDQFGGKAGGAPASKFGRKRLRELLAGTAPLQVTKQHTYLEQALVHWQGEQPQTDDVTVIGLKI
jgi:serine phosphatase RsbU (regulator of sigma subunit)